MSQAMLRDEIEFLYYVKSKEIKPMLEAGFQAEKIEVDLEERNFSNRKMRLIHKPTNVLLATILLEAEYHGPHDFGDYDEDENNWSYYYKVETDKISEAMAERLTNKVVSIIMSEKAKMKELLDKGFDDDVNDFIDSEHSPSI